MTTAEFIDKYKWLAIYNHLLYGIPASITLAQGIIESKSGNSKLATEANNFFGIKAYSNPDNLAVYYADDDLKHEPFRKYTFPVQSFNDHSKFLLSNQRYIDTLKTGNYVDFAIELKKAGYATSPTYAKSLINTIDSNNLKKFDVWGNNKYIIGLLVLLTVSFIIYGIYKRKRK